MRQPNLRLSSDLWSKLLLDKRQLGHDFPKKTVLPSVYLFLVCYLSGQVLHGGRHVVGREGVVPRDTHLGERVQDSIPLQFL